MRFANETSVVAIEPIGYEFPATADHEFDWIVIALEVVLPDASWSCSAAALTTSEAKDLGSWLRSAAQGAIESVEPDDEDWLAPNLTFIEPDLAFGVAAANSTVVDLRVYLSHSLAAPDLPSEEQTSLWQFFVPVRVTVADLIHAADEWETALQGVPER